jgi:hypothetical protein
MMSEPAVGGFGKILSNFSATGITALQPIAARLAASVTVDGPT